MDNKGSKIDFKVLFESAPGLYLVLSPELVIVGVNDAYAKATMTKREEITGRHLFDVFPDNPDDHAADGVSNLRSSLNSVLKNKIAHTMAVQKYDIRRPDGAFEERYWSPLNTPVLSYKNEVVYIIHRVEDVTDFIRLQKEQYLKEKIADELRERSREMEIEIYKRSQEIQKLNEELELKVMERTVELELSKEELKKLNLGLEEKIKERTLKLTNALEREKGINEMKSHFVSMASHEFRTPLATILSSLALVKKYNESDQQENRLKHINRIHSSVKNLTDILGDFLSLSQLEKGIVEVDNDIFSLNDFIGTVVEEADGLTSKKNQQIIHEHYGEDKIENSKKILKNVLLNLLSNASKYSSEGEKIHIISSVNNQGVSIIVKDHGIGIPEEDQQKLFTEFFRASNVENVQGTGLGLSIVKKYMELVDGNINFFSKPYEGTAFTVEFPRYKANLVP
jgi:signal transduction histidine kinase